MDAERGFSEERWYPDDRGYPDPDWRQSGRGAGYEPERGGPAQRAYPPDPRYPGFGEPGYAEPGYTAPRDPAFDPGFDRHGTPPAGGDPRQAGGAYVPRPADRPPMPPEPGRPSEPSTAEVPRAARGDSVYRSRKPLHAAVLGIVLGVFELIMLLQFIRGVFGSPSDLHRILAGGLMLMALPAFGLGLYALLTGGAHSGPRAFLKTPLAYLPLGLILMVAAGAAA